jgi:molybdopterin molybdotransferase
MVPVAEHLAQVLAAIRPLAPVRLGLEQAEFCVLAEDAAARCPLPSFDNSAMDGYAVHAADVAAAAPGAPVVLPVTSQIAAGDTRAVTLPPGCAAQITTGALLPAGADAVVPVEWTDGGTGQARGGTGQARDGAGQVRISRPAPAGHAIRRRGGDVAEGEVLVPAGSLLGPPQIALLAAGGHSSATVRPGPRAVVIATGNELTEPGTPLAPGQIWESNSYLLAAAVRQAGGVASRHRLSDDTGAVLAAVDRHSQAADLLITTGGVSMGGEHDVVKAALAARAGMTFRRVAMQPGMPQGFGLTGPDGTPIFTLPGNPVSAYVSFQLFVRPAMQAMQGREPTPLPVTRAILTGPASSPEGKRSFLRGVLDPATATVAPLTGQGSHQLGVLARANALIVVPEEVVRMEEGDPADVISLP